jgi:hypothetical protein
LYSCLFSGDSKKTRVLYVRKTEIVHTNSHLMRCDLDAENMLFAIQGKLEGRIDVTGRRRRRRK